MQHEHTGIRAGGAWLAIASILMAAALVVHGPIAAELSDQMTRISDRPGPWSLAHWLAAAGLSFFAITGLIVLTSRSGLTDGPWRMSAWAVLLVGGLWTLNTAVAEATVVTEAAVAGNSALFETWWAFAEGKANGFSFLALALAVIAASDARGAPGATPAWAGWAGMGAGIGSFMGWALGMWLGVGIGMPLWLAASVLMTAWAAWFGVALARAPASARPSPAPASR